MDALKTFSFATSMAKFAADVVQALHKMEKCFGPDFRAKPTRFLFTRPGWQMQVGKRCHNDTK